MVSSLVRVLLPLLFVYSAVAAPRLTVGREQRVSLPEIGPPTSGQSNGALATRGSDALAVWTDGRGDSGDGLFATRIAADGTILDPHGIMIDGRRGESPAVAWNGVDYLVVANEPTVDPYAVGPLYSWRIRPDGTRVGEKRLVGTIERTRLAGNGREVLLTGTAPEGTVVAFFDGHGHARTRARIAGKYAPAVPLADETGWVVFVVKPLCDTCSNSLVQVRLDSKGAIVAEKRLLAAPSIHAIDVASDGAGRFLVSWAYMQSGTADTYMVEVARALIDRAGTVLAEPAVIDRTFATLPGSAPQWGSSRVADRPAVVWDHDHFVVAWKWLDGSGAEGLRAARIDASGRQLDAAPVTFARATSHFALLGANAPVLARTDTHILLQWSRLEPKPPASRVARLVQRAATSFAGLVDDTAPSLVSTEGATQPGLKLAHGDSSMFAVWPETEGVGVLKARAFPHGGGPASAPVHVSTGLRVAHAAEVLAGGGIFFVVWRETEYDRVGPSITHIYARRYDRHGTALDPEPLRLNVESYGGRYAPHTSLGIAFDGEQFLVAWAAAHDAYIHGKRVALDGTIVDSYPRIFAGKSSGTLGSPRLVWTGSDYAMIWYENPTPSSNGGAPLPILAHYARMTRIGRDGAVLDRTFAPLVTTPPGFDLIRSDFAVGSNGRELALTWSYLFHNETPVRGCAYAQRFTMEGTSIDRAPVELYCQRESWSPLSTPVWYDNEWWVAFVVPGSERGVFVSKLFEAAPHAPNALRITGAEHSSGFTQLLATPTGMTVGYLRVDESIGYVRAAFFARLGAPRVRAVRH